MDELMTNKELAVCIKHSRTHNEFLVSFFDWAERIEGFVNNTTYKGNEDCDKASELCQEYKELLTFDN